MREQMSSNGHKPGDLADHAALAAAGVWNA